MNGKVTSPLTGSDNVRCLRSMKASEIIAIYQKTFGIDIGYIFAGVPEVREFKCNDTGYRFYEPLNISGDDAFYRHFGKYDWYYLPWKWEHEKALEFMRPDDRILEVGAGRGSFLDAIQKKGYRDVAGLELNSDAVAEARAHGVNLIRETIEQHSMTNAGKYDVVCSFQVLEHISNAGEVLSAMTNCLRQGGTLIVSVPNNDSYLKHNPLPSRVLNMPPHHMGLWNLESLKNLQRILPLALTDTFIEPLQKIHADTYQYVMVNKMFLGSMFLTRVYWKLRLNRVVRPILGMLSKYLVGQSILAVYQKKDARA